MTITNKELPENTEVKLMLNEKTVMLDNFNLNKKFIKQFSINKKAANMKIWYLDTNNHNFKNQNWIIRYRYHDNCDFELAYKKRYSESEYENIIKTDIEEKISKKFKPEIDIGY